MPRKTASKAIAKSKKEKLDPRKTAFLVAYIDPKSPTFGNALQSALAAKYSQEYAENITNQMPNWLAENLGKERRIKLAEKHIDEMLDLPLKVPAMGAFGPVIDKNTKKPIMVNSMEVAKQKTKITEFVLERLDKKNYGRENGPKLSFNFNLTDDKSRFQ